MTRILLVEGNNMEAGGVEAYLLNVLSQINRDNLELDVLVPGKVVSRVTADRFNDIGCRIHQLDIESGGFNRNIELWNKVGEYLKNNSYDVIHVNTANLRVEAISLSLASKAGIEVRIAHSHGTLMTESTIKEELRNLLRIVIRSKATEFLACSSAAAEALVGKKYSPEVKIARNGINVKDYAFNQQKRAEIRERCGWNNKFVVGFIARISPEKNHLFMLQVIKKLSEMVPNVLLAVVGAGDEKNEQLVRKNVEAWNLQNNVQLLGERNDISLLVQGMDLHVLPSIREALGIVNIEAQASGLRCICSDRVPRDADVTGLVDFVSLEKGVDYWAKIIAQYEHGYKRMNTTEMIIDKGYDITASAKIVENIYSSLPETGGGIIK